MTGPEVAKTKDFVSWAKTPTPSPGVEAMPVEYEQSFEDAYISDFDELYTGLDYDGELFYYENPWIQNLRDDQCTL